MFKHRTDGGPESHVTGWFVPEIKRLFSIVLLHFAPGTREAYHSHAFHTVSWLLKGELHEHMLDGSLKVHTPSLRPIITKRSTFHKVFSPAHSWAVSFRGPWATQWQEWLPGEQRFVTLTHGRKVVR